MQIRLNSRLHGKIAYALRIGDATTDVIRLFDGPASSNHHRLAWSGGDGRRYAVDCPIDKQGSGGQWELLVEGDTVAVGAIGRPIFWDRFWHKDSGRLRWKADGVTYVERNSFCGGKLVDQDEVTHLTWKVVSLKEIRAVVRKNLFGGDFYAAAGLLIGSVYARGLDPYPT